MARRGEAIRVEGLRELRRDLRAADAALPKQLSKTNKAIVNDVVVPEAKRIVPIRTGRLQGNIRALAGQTSAKIAAGGAKVPYAGPIHFGWPAHGIEPQPFLYDALDNRRNEIMDRYEKMVDKVTSKPFPE